VRVPVTRPSLVAKSPRPASDAPEPVRKLPKPPAEHAKPVEARPPTQGIEGVIEEGPPFRLERAPSLREAVAHNVAVRAATPTFRVTAELSIEAVQALAKKQAISLTALLARACAAAISADPLFNAAWTGHGLAHRTRVDIGIAIDSPDGLFTPVLRHLRALSHSTRR